MYVLYTLIFAGAALLLTPWALFLLLTRSGMRRHFLERFGRLPRALREDRRPTIWLHAVSVGEVRAARALLEGLKAEHPEHRLVLSTTTPAGRQVAEREGAVADALIYLPLDLPPFPGRALRALDCRLFIAIETEIWPSLLRACGRMGIPAVILNGRISDRSFPRYRLLRPFLRKVLKNLTFAAMQSWRDAERLAWIGMPAEKLGITGNVKFDMASAEPPPGNPAARLLASHRGPVFVAGSTAPGEETEVLEAVETLRAEVPDLLLVIAPRQPARFDEVAGLLRERGAPFLRRTELDGEPAVGARLLLLDTLGELASLYHHADAVFVGGSLVPVGGHNLLEPAAAGKPVLFGPHVENCRQVATLLLQGGGAAQVQDREGLTRQLREILRDDELRDRLGREAQAVVERNRGAVVRSLQIVRHFFLNQGPRPETMLQAQQG